MDQAVDNNGTEPASTEPVTESDVTEIREFLDTFNGDFKRLFAKG
jgi:hypothetical protein